MATICCGCGKQATWMAHHEGKVEPLCDEAKDTVEKFDPKATFTPIRKPKPIVA